MITGSFFGKEPGKTFHVGHNSGLPTTANSGVNVLYFTNKCNLACTYCYEDLPGRPPQILTQENIMKIVDSVLEREDPNNQTLFVLFGGEATLEWENVCFAMDYAFKKKTNVRFNLETNGIKFLSPKFLEEYKKNFYVRSGLLSVDISFDGTGNKDRIYHNGMESTSSMLKVFKTLNEHRVRYRIRYTIQHLNVDHLYEDITRIIKTFKPERLITSVAWDTLKPEDSAKLEEAKNLFRKDWLNKQISVPICELFCDMCSGCGERKEIKTYFTTEGNVTTYGVYENAPKFHDFKEKEIS